MTKEKIALIGYGYWGKKIYRYLKNNEEFDLRYVFFRGLKDLDEDTIKQKYGIEFVSEIELILNDKSVPNIVIATPVDTHYALTKQALNKSKNVLVEKPLATNSSQCQELIEIAQQKNLKLETEYTFTYSEAFVTAQKLIETGAIGKIESVSLTKKQLGRFLVYDVYTLLGTHCLSILDMFIPIRNYKFSAKPLMTTNGVITSAIINFENKEERVQGFIDLSLHCPDKQTKVVIYGEKGTLSYNPNSANPLELVCYSRYQVPGESKVAISEEKIYTSDENNNLQRAVKNFSNVINNKAADNSMRAKDITDIIADFQLR